MQRRWMRMLARGIPGAAVATSLVLLALRPVAPSDIFEWRTGLALLVLLGSVGATVYRRARRRLTRAPARVRDDLELGASLIAATFWIVAISGNLLFPLVYLLMAFSVGFLPWSSGWILLGVALVFDGVLTLAPPVSDPVAFATHAAFFLLFAGLYRWVLASRLALAKKAEGEAVQKRLREVEERARAFRLASSGSHDSFPGMAAQEKWLLASVSEVEGAVGSALEVIEAALKPHACAVFLLSADEQSLRLYDCRSEDDGVSRERFSAGEGALGSVVKRAIPVRLSNPTALRGVSYYEAERDIRSLMAVPISEPSGTVRGVLVVDRLEETAFTEDDEHLAKAVASQVWRAMEGERVVTYIRKARDEKDRFFRALEELNRAGSPEQVFGAVMESARQLAQVDFCAVTMVSEENDRRQHVIVRMTGVANAGQALEGRAFADNHGLVANVVRYGAPLPGRDIGAMDRQVIFDDEMQVRGLASLKIFPMRAGERILGTLVAGSRKRGVLDDDALRMLEVVASQAAQALLRAQLYAQMEKMATTDGLTGVMNHRAFQARAEELLAQARRYGRQCSLLLTDIDHFKSVNDTYGHPTGDGVLRGIAAILREQARDTDSVARYGGEEFALLMPETDVKGARVIAERIREAVLGHVFHSEQGPIKVTLSIGVVTCPDHGDDKEKLVELADQSLYRAKHGGRNRVVVAHDPRSAPRAAGA